MKYNKREIMKRAWEIKRQDSRSIFGLCLKMAWEEVKKVGKLIGRWHVVMTVKAWVIDKAQQTARLYNTYTNLVLSDKAQKFYNGTDPIDIYEYDDGDVCYYTIKLWGDRESSPMTAEEINAELEAIADSLDCGDDDE